MSTNFSHRAAPLILRVVLGGTFLWAGLAKVLSTFTPTPEQAAALANMGVQVDGGPAPVQPGTAVPDVLPPGSAAPGTTPPPATTPRPTTKPETPLPAPGEEPMPADRFSGPKSNPDAGKPPSTKPVPPPEPRFRSVDFPAPKPVRTLYGIALVVESASNPAKGTAFWPDAIGDGRSAVWTAYLITATEIAAGALLLIGFLSRFCGLTLAGVMLGALWLTQMGPAIRSGNTTAGIFPAYPLFDTQQWMPFLWNTSLLAMALAVMFLGSGALGLDRALVSRGHRADDSDDGA